jgi:hypothetical protein
MKNIIIIILIIIAILTIKKYIKQKKKLTKIKGELFCEDCIESEKFMLSDLPDYFIGEEGDLKHYKEVFIFKFF